jgi:hypothetical protein
LPKKQGLQKPNRSARSAQSTNPWVELPGRKRYPTPLASMYWLVYFPIFFRSRQTCVSTIGVSIKRSGRGTTSVLHQERQEAILLASQGKHLVIQHHEFVAQVHE